MTLARILKYDTRVEGYTSQPADNFHQFDGSCKARAASVLNTVGCEWRHAEMEHWASEAFPHLTGQTAARGAGKPDDEKDPIFAAIEKHRAHEAEFVRAADVDDETQEVIDAAGDRSSEARREFLETVPQSAMGIRAAIEHLFDYYNNIESYIPQDEAVTLFESILASPLLPA